MSNALLNALNDAAAQIGRAFPDVDVATHAGRFSMEELKRIAVKPPAIRLALLAIPPTVREKDGSIYPEVQWAAFVITADRAGRSRADWALELVNQLYLWLPFKQWECTKALNANTLDARNLYGADLDSKTSCAIWAITWRQTITLKGAIT